MSRHWFGRALSVSLAVAVTGGLTTAADAGADTVRVGASDYINGTVRFEVREGRSLVVRKARLRANGTSAGLRLRGVRRGVRRGLVRVRVPSRLRVAASAAKARRVSDTRLVMKVRRKKPPTEPAPTEPTPTEPTPTEPEPEPGSTAPVAPKEPIPAGAYYLSPSGSDSNPGTADRPWQTLKKAVATVKPGDTVVLRSGTYGARGTVHYMNKPGTASAPVTYRSHPGEAMPRILGHFRISAGYQRFSHMLFDGPTGTVKPLTTENPRGENVQVSIVGSSVTGVEILHSEIRNSDWHAGVYLNGAENARLIGNYIHDNGDENDPGQANLSHGIYWNAGSGLIANNVVEHNLARGIQLYKAPTKVTIANNTIVKNGKAGIMFCASTTNSVAVNNLVAHNQYGIRASSLTGIANVVRDNMLWDNSAGNLALTTGLTLSNNRMQDARFMGANDYRLQAASPAIDSAVASFAPTNDFTTLARPMGAAPDLGAYESG